MAKREEIIDTLVVYYSAQIQKWDDRNYPYWSTVGDWFDHENAYNQIKDIHMGKYRIVRKSLDLLDSGRIQAHDMFVVWENHEWVRDEFDPRIKDPDFKKYIELKKRFEQ